MSNFRAIALLSGGLDSAVSMGIALREGRSVFPLLFDYGQRHKRELDSAEKIVVHYQKKYPHRVAASVTVNLSQIGDSALTKKSIEVPRNQHAFASRIPVTYVPARNSIFLSIAASFAETEQCDEIWVGFNYVDYSGYPDCRPEFVEAMQNALNVGTKRGVEGRLLQIRAPIIRETKEEIIYRALDMNVPLALTWSCYVGGDYPCGTCDSCLIRHKAFDSIGIKDPAL